MVGDGCLVVSDEEMLMALSHWFSKGIGTRRDVGTFEAIDLRRCEHKGRPHWKVSFVGDQAASTTRDKVLREAVTKANKIEAIKFVRASLGYGIKEAKEAVDDVWEAA